MEIGMEYSTHLNDKKREMCWKSGNEHQGNQNWEKFPYNTDTVTKTEEESDVLDYLEVSYGETDSESRIEGNIDEIGACVKIKKETKKEFETEPSLDLSKKYIAKTEIEPECYDSEGDGAPKIKMEQTFFVDIKNDIKKEVEPMTQKVELESAEEEEHEELEGFFFVDIKNGIKKEVEPINEQVELESAEEEGSGEVEGAACEETLENKTEDEQSRDDSLDRQPRFFFVDIKNDIKKEVEPMDEQVELGSAGETESDEVGGSAYLIGEKALENKTEDVHSRNEKQEQQSCQAELKKDLSGRPPPPSNPLFTKHVCNVCKKTFYSRSELDHHVKIHSEERPFSCEQCGKVFKYKYNLVKHCHSHSDEKTYSCEHCDKTFAYMSNLQEHLITHTGKRPHRCNQCGKGFLYKRNLEQHSRIHTGVLPHRCEQCGKAFLYKHVLVKHSRTHTAKVYWCEQCDRTFSQLSSLEKHRLERCNKNIKDKQQEHSEKCGKEDLVLHSRIHGRHEWPPRCKKCGLVFLSKILLDEHSCNHSSEPLHHELYRCEKCGKKFKEMSTLQLHRLIHKDKQQLQLYEEGDKVLESKQESAIVSRIKAATRPPCCKKCGLVFLAKNLLDEHNCNYSGEQYCLNHKDKQPQRSKECEKIFVNKQVSAIRSCVSSTKRSPCCKKCGLVFLTKNLLDEHSCNHPGKQHHVNHEVRQQQQQQQQQLCNDGTEKVFASKQESVKHSHVNNAKRPHRCKKCSLVFLSKNLLDEHDCSHNSELHRCEQCGKKFKEMNTLQKHCLKHKDKQQQRCDDCGKVFECKQESAQRYFRYSTADWPPRCLKCGMVFLSKNLLDEHHCNHERLHRCEECEMAFVNRIV